MIYFFEKHFIMFLEGLGGVSIFFVTVLKTLFTTHGNLKPILAQVASISLRSLSTVLFSGVFVGAILVLQFNLILSNYNAESLLGGLNTSTVIRDVGPLIISFLLAGKVGAFTAAELGTMRVTEQIDAIECLGTSSIQYLIVPRFMGIIISNIFLLVSGLVVSIGGAIFVASVCCHVNSLQFMSSIPRFASAWTIIGSFFKSVMYSTIVATVACYKGYTVSGGARGVGRGVTAAAVLTNFYILVASFCSNYFLQFAEELVQTLHGVYP